MVLAKHGANIAFTYSSSVDSAISLTEEISALNVKCKGYQSNAASFEDSQKLVDQILLDFDNIDVLINNAGITKDNLLMRMTEEDFDKVIDVNLKSVFNMVKAVQRTFLKNKSRKYSKHKFNCWSKRKRRTSKLCCFKSWYYWILKINCFRVGI